MNCSGIWNETVGAYDLDDQGWADYNVVSVSCGLYPCARHMKAEVKNGQFLETVLREQLYDVYDNSYSEEDANLTIFKLTGKFDSVNRKPVAFHPPCWVNGTRYDEPSENMTVTTNLNQQIINISRCAYGVSMAFDTKVKDLVEEMTSGNCSVLSMSIPPYCQEDQGIDFQCNNKRT